MRYNLFTCSHLIFYYNIKTVLIKHRTFPQLFGRILSKKWMIRVYRLTFTDFVQCRITKDFRLSLCYQ